jgi:uncharacterized phiE125 gp8 family phage protein
MYPLVTVVDTEPTVEPITLAEAKNQLRIDHTDHDDMITGMIKSAREEIESMCARAIVQQTRIAYFDKWPDDKVFHLLYPEIRSITHIKYTDSAGTQETFSSDDYSLDPGSEPGRVVRGYGKTWPTVTLHNEDYPIEIKYVCGYAPEGSYYTANIPERIKLACRLMVVSFYGGMPEDYSKYRDDAIQNLLRPYRVWRQ